jgi:uncharacterized protein (TIGR02246 family)
VADRDEIEALIFEYARRIDDGDFDGVGELFAHGAVTMPDGTVLAEGSDAVAALYAATTRRYPEGTPRSHHVTTNVVVRAEGDEASAQSYFTVFQATDGVPLQPIVTGRYQDRFQRVDGAWRFARRGMEVRLVGDVSQHLLIEL